MKGILSILSVMIVVLSFAVVGSAGTFDEKCAVCHKPANKPALSKESLLKKFKSADELVKAAKASTNPMMKAVQGNEDLLKKAAADIGLK
ncbi:MAG: hypothetical protein ACK4Z9_08835 [Thermodesulfovibrionales bacterium]